MCLMIPGKIIKRKGDAVVVDYGSEQRSATLVEEGFDIGDYVIVQGGFVVQKVPEEEALESLKLYNEAVSA